MLRQFDSETDKDHFVIISDVPFLGLANKKIHEHYRGSGISFNRDIEFGNGCASQSMSKTAIYLLVQRERFTIYAYFETSHGKSKSDGLGSVVKFYVSREVAANELIIRNGKMFMNSVWQTSL